MMMDNLEKQLQNLPDTVSEMMADVVMPQSAKAEILQKVEAKKQIRFRPLRAIPALCAACLLLMFSVFGFPYFMMNKQNSPIQSAPAGQMEAQIGGNQLTANLPSGSVTFSNAGSVPEYRNIFASGSASPFPLVVVQGKAYRMLSTPRSLSSGLIGGEHGTVTTFSNAPSGEGISSNVVLEGTPVYDVQGMSGTMVTAEVGGKMRVFQRHSYQGNALMGGESLGSVLKAGAVQALMLSGVGEVTGNDAQTLYNTLVNNASYQGAETQKTNQTLLIKLTNGLTMQLFVSGNQVNACGTWTCQPFFDAFQ